MNNWTTAKNGAVDQILATLYLDKYILATACIPGTNTLRKNPQMPEQTVVFKKEYLSQNAPPLKRGETPEREYRNATELSVVLPSLPIPKSYGYDQNVYYGELIKAKELDRYSPFNPVITKCLEPCQPPVCGWEKYTNGLEKLHGKTCLLHSQGFLHNDLHTGNILVDTDGNFTIIDLGGVTRSQLLSHDEVVEDILKVEREIVLTAYHSRNPMPDLLNNPLELFPVEISQKLFPLDIGV